jgi:iron uptake system component EfeO
MLIGVALAVSSGLVLSACGHGSHPGAAATVQSRQSRISVSVNQCGSGWTDIKPGQQDFLLQNTDTRAGEVLLTDAVSAKVFADVEPLGPGTTTPLSITLGSGKYAFRCAMEDTATVVGPTVTVPGSVKQPVAPISSVTENDLIAVTQKYEAYVKSQIPTLIKLTDQLSTQVKGGELAAARAAWLPAHLEYERLGAAYDAFGDLDASINETPNGLPGRIKDKDWTGFHRIEYGLWHSESPASLTPQTKALSTAVHGLASQFATAQIDPLDVSIRAHEITENAVQFELTGETDFGSHTNLATVRANLDGTQAVLGIIRPVLAGRDSQLPALTTELSRAEADLDRLHPGRSEGSSGWPALTDLPIRDREQINADLSELSELLAPIASILEPRRAS